MLRGAAFLTAVLVAAPAAADEHARPARFQATAYCQTGTTASGTQTRPGVIAADPRVFPRGTVIRVDAPLRGYSGTYRVEDTGLAVKGRVIDIYVPDCKAAKRFGRRHVMVRVIERGPEVELAAKEVPVRSKER